MAQRRDQLGRMPAIAGRRRSANVVNDHMLDAPGTMLLVQKILAQHGGWHLGQMLMLGDGGDFRLAQAAQGDTILKSNHVESVPVTRRRTLIVRKAAPAEWAILFPKGES